MAFLCKYFVESSTEVNEKGNAIYDRLAVYSGRRYKEQCVLADEKVKLIGGLRKISFRSGRRWASATGA